MGFIQCEYRCSSLETSVSAARKAVSGTVAKYHKKRVGKKRPIINLPSPCQMYGRQLHECWTGQ